MVEDISTLHKEDIIILLLHPARVFPSLSLLQSP